MKTQTRWLPLFQNLILSFLSLLIGLIVLFYITRWAAMASCKRLPFIKSKRLSWLAERFTDKSFGRFLEAVKSVERDKFSTVWDFNAGVRLSKNLFLEETMFGQAKFRYKPDVGIYNVVVWSGTSSLGYVVAETPEINEALKECQVLRSVHFKTDRYGFKPTQFAPNASSPSIFFLGDSFTEGLWVSPEQTFVNLFGRKLKSGGARLIPVNLGVNGYGTLEMSWMLEHFAPLLNPKWVVVNLFPNDVDAHYYNAVKGESVPEEHYQQMFHDLDQIRIYCAQHKIGLVVSVLPLKEQFHSLARHHYFQDRVKMWCRDRQLECLDPREEFKKFGTRKIYFSWDPHFSEEGHSHYADFLYDHLVSSLR